jgi:hypothetical protein
MVGNIKSRTFENNRNGQEKASGFNFAFWTRNRAIIVKALFIFKIGFALRTGILVCWHAILRNYTSVLQN